jgi:hypothetical protein
VAGIVYDAAWRPLPGARVEAADGPGAGASAIADARGEFRLTGEFDAATHFRAATEGYVASTTTLPPPCASCRPNWWIFFSLASVVPPVNLAGDYTLSIVAGACPTLPDALRSRTYDATITLAPDPTRARFNVAVHGSLVEGYRTFQIGVVGNYGGGYLGDGHGTPGLVEQIGRNSYFTVAGEIGVAVTETTIAATLRDGVVEQCDLTSDWGSRYSCSQSGAVSHVSCGSPAHRLTLTRR